MNFPQESLDTIFKLSSKAEAERSAWLQSNDLASNSNWIFSLLNGESRTDDIFANGVVCFAVRHHLIEPAPQSTWREYKSEAIGLLAITLYRKLALLAADGDSNAIASCAVLAIHSTADVHLLPKTPSTLKELNRVASAHTHWPVLQKHAPPGIELGTKLPRFRRELDRVAGPAQTIARYYLHIIQTYREEPTNILTTISDTRRTKADLDFRATAKALPNFSDKSWPQWFDLLWKIIMGRTRNAPEEVKRLRELGQRGTKKYETKLQSRSATKSIKSNIRAYIKEALKRTVERLANSAAHALLDAKGSAIDS